VHNVGSTRTTESIVLVVVIIIIVVVVVVVSIVITVVIDMIGVIVGVIVGMIVVAIEIVAIVATANDARVKRRTSSERRARGDIGGVGRERTGALSAARLDEAARQHRRVVHRHGRSGMRRLVVGSDGGGGREAG
jgi:ABC-type multidrug transport system fused ATPase/permease subunit